MPAAFARVAAFLLSSTVVSLTFPSLWNFVQLFPVGVRMSSSLILMVEGVIAGFPKSILREKPTLPLAPVASKVGVGSIWGFPSSLSSTFLFILKQ